MGRREAPQLGLKNPPPLGGDDENDDDDDEKWDIPGSPCILRLRLAGLSAGGSVLPRSGTGGEYFWGRLMRPRTHPLGSGFFVARLVHYLVMKQYTPIMWY